MYADHCFEQSPIAITKKRRHAAGLPIMPFMAQQLKILRRVRELPGVKKVFIRSGIRFDYLMADPDDTFFIHLRRSAPP